MFRHYWSELRNEIWDWRQLYFFRRPVLWILVAFCTGIFIAKRIGVWDRVDEHDPSHWNGQRCAVTGIVTAQPDARPNGCVYLINAETVETFENHERRCLQGSLLLQILKSTAPIASPGDRVRAVGRLQFPKAALTPGAFDYADYLADKGIRTVIYTSSKSVEVLGDAGHNTLQRIAWGLKQKSVRIFETYLNSDQSTVLSGLVVGNRPRFNPEIKRIFIESGTMHVLVASGSNVAFVMALCLIFFRLLGIPLKIAVTLTLPCIWIYVLLAGADAPIARAGLMGTIGVFSFLLVRNDQPYNALGLTALIILTFDPHALFDIGFQMSFVTVFGLIYFLTPLEPAMQNIPLWLRWPLRLLATTLTAQIWLVPITAATFQRFFPVSVVSNIFVVPFSGIGLPIGLALVIGHGISAIVTLARIYSSCLIALVKFFADRLGTSLWVSPPSMMTTIGFYVTCLSIVFVRKSAFARTLCTLGILCVGVGIIQRHYKHQKPKGLRVTWIDNGKRLTTLVETADGKNVLINPGSKEPYDSTERTLMPFLTQHGIHHLDAVFITNPNREQTDGIESLTRWVNVSTVIACNAAFLEFSDGKNKILLTETLRLKTQDWLLSRNKRYELIQSHFPRNWRWREEFLQRLKPNLVVETHSISDFHPSVPPWDDIPLVIPQKLGWYEWASEPS